VSSTIFEGGVGRRVFGADVEGYEAGRPDYPEELFEILEARSALRSGIAIFEVGPGTGQATEQLLRRRPSRMVAIEPDERLAQHLTGLRAEAPTDFRVEATAFEDSALEPASFDLGVAATSFHWLPARPALAKVRRLLKPGGWWAMWWNVYRGMDELAEAGFVSSSFTLIRREHKLSAAQLRALYSTFSAIRLLPPEDARRRLDAIEQLADRDFGGAAQRTILTPLYWAQAPH
jgi:SAM-dependent methyltransferase